MAEMKLKYGCNPNQGSARVYVQGDLPKRAAKLWNEVQCVKIIALLSETDLELRSLGTSLQNIVMDMCLYEIACKSGNKIEKYTADNI